jgi:hypothetical protein
VAFAAAGNSSRSSHDGVDDATGFAKRVTSELAISDEQRGRIYDSVMRISDAPIAGEPAPEVFRKAEILLNVSETESFCRTKRSSILFAITLDYDHPSKRIHQLS